MYVVKRSFGVPNNRIFIEFVSAYVLTKCYEEILIDIG